jgi:hypothetical protein
MRHSGFYTVDTLKTGGNAGVAKSSKRIRMLLPAWRSTLFVRKMAKKSHK